MKVTTLIAFGLIVLTGFLIWRPAGQTVPRSSSECSCPFCLAASPGNSQEQRSFSEALSLVGNRAKSTEPAAAGKLAGQPAPPSCSKPATAPAAAGKVVATVNGEPIFESDLMAGLPDDAFQVQLDDLKESKLERLVEEVVQRQFLNDRKATLSDEEVERAAADFETMIKTPGCPCCGGGFRSVGQYMRVNYFSPPELRRRITCDSGLRLYTARLEKEQTTPQALAETIKKHRAEIEKNRMMAYRILFVYASDPAYFGDEKTVKAKKEKIANDALARLKKGDSFEEVAKDLSKNGLSDPKGASLDCIRADILAPELQTVLETLDPGKFSPVIKPGWGCCIVKRKKLTDEDILSIAKEQAKTSAVDQMNRELGAWRKRAKIQYSAAYARASASGKSGAK